MIPATIGFEGVLIVGFVVLLVSIAIRFVIRGSWGAHSSGAIDGGGSYFWPDVGSDSGGYDAGDCGGGGDGGGGCGGD